MIEGNQRPHARRDLSIVIAVVAFLAVAGLVPAVAADSDRETDGTAAVPSSTTPGTAVTDGQGMGAPATPAQIEALEQLDPRVAANADNSAPPNLSETPVGSSPTPEEFEEFQRDWERDHPRSSPSAQQASRTAYESLDRSTAANLFAEAAPALVWFTKISVIKDRLHVSGFSE